MLKIYFGNDTIKARRQALSDADSLRSEGATVELLESETFVVGSIRNAAGGASLFGNSFCYVVDMPSGDATMGEEFKESLPLLADSANVFIVIEGPLLAAEKKALGKYAKEMEEYKVAPKERFNNFALADAFSRRDRKSLWLLFHEAKLSGTSLEELVGILWWQMKTIRLAFRTSSAEEAGMKDFPYQKAKRSAAKFKAGELEEFSRTLLSLLHDSRLGLADLDVSFERWILKI